MPQAHQGDGRTRPRCAEHEVPARAQSAVEQRAGELRADDHAHGLGEGAQSGGQRGHSPVVLEVERDGEQGAEEGYRVHRHDRAAGGEQTVRQQPYVDHRGLLAEFDDNHRGDQDGSAGQAEGHRGRGPTLLGSLRDAVHQQAESGRREQEPGTVEALRGPCGLVAQAQRPEDGREEADGHVDVEDRPPGDPGDQHAAEHRAERGG